jgi:cytochrome P450
MGIHFAMLEMVLVLSSLLRRFAVEPAVPVVEPEALITLRPKGGIPLRIRRRP